MIYKTLHLPIIQPNKESEEILGVPTTIINEETIKHIELIKNSGGIFQEYIEKEYEIRVTIIGRKIFASKIDSQKDELSKIDWRDGVFYGRVNVYPYNLPKNVKQQCLNIVEKLGLKFGAIDLIKTPNNEYVFLEINPNGQWLWIEELTEQPLVEAMANLLSNPLI